MRYHWDRSGKPRRDTTVQNAFDKARRLASTDDVLPYDLRGTFATHRAIVVKNFRQLRIEMGHSSPNSIQSYLDEARRLRQDESIFFVPEAGNPATESVENGHKSGHFSGGESGPLRSMS